MTAAPHDRGRRYDEAAVPVDGRVLVVSCPRRLPDAAPPRLGAPGRTDIFIAESSQKPGRWAAYYRNVNGSLSRFRPSSLRFRFFPTDADNQLYDYVEERFDKGWIICLEGVPQ